MIFILTLDAKCIKALKKYNEQTESCLFLDGWCLEAFSLAQGRMLEELTNILVMVVVGKVCIKLPIHFFYTCPLRIAKQNLASRDFCRCVEFLNQCSNINSGLESILATQQIKVNILLEKPFLELVLVIAPSAAHCKSTSQLADC